MKTSYAEGRARSCDDATLPMPLCIRRKHNEKKSGTILTELVSLLNFRYWRYIGMPAIVQRCLLLPRGFLGVNRYDCFDHVPCYDGNAWPQQRYCSLTLFVLFQRFFERKKDTDMSTVSLGFASVASKIMLNNFLLATEQLCSWPTSVLPHKQQSKHGC